MTWIWGILLGVVMSICYLMVIEVLEVMLNQVDARICSLIITVVAGVFSVLVGYIKNNQNTEKQEVYNDQKKK